MSRRIAALLVATLLLVGCSGGSQAPGNSASGNEMSQSPQEQAPNQSPPEQRPSQSPQPGTTAPAPSLELPNGGRRLFPQYRLCGFVGYPGASGQGRLGIGDINERMVELHQTCQPYGTDAQIMPVMELITVTVAPAPGPDGMWRERTDPAIIDSWLTVARANNALLLLDIQPGHSDFLTELQALEPYLIQPDVGVALDPEWAMKPGEIPMQSFGSTSGEELDRVSAYLAGLVRERNLPEKVMLYHILHPEIITNEWALQQRPGVVAIKSVDGIGSPADKIATYERVKAEVPPFVFMGFKLFFEEDANASGVVMSPEEVLGLNPVPSYVMYE